MSQPASKAGKNATEYEEDLSDGEREFVAKYGREALIEQYDAITRFRDDIFAGHHPRFKRNPITGVIVAIPSPLPKQRGIGLADFDETAPAPAPQPTSPKGIMPASSLSHPPQDHNYTTTATSISSVKLFNPTIHGRFRPKPQLSVAAQPPPPAIFVTSTTNPSIRIDITHNYYADLGVQPHSPTRAIKKAFSNKRELYSPLSEGGKKRWFSKNKDTRTRTSANWYTAEKAFKILGNEELRREFDNRYVGGTILGGTRKGREKDLLTGVEDGEILEKSAPRGSSSRRGRKGYY